MKILPLALVAGFALGPAFGLAQQPTQDDLRSRYAEKLTHEFVKTGGWTVDYDAARERAAKEKKLLFTYFTRTYSP